MIWLGTNLGSLANLHQRKGHPVVVKHAGAFHPGLSQLRYKLFANENYYESPAGG